MNDALGMVLKEGDYVAFLQPGTRDINLGLVSRFTSKRVGVKPVHYSTPVWSLKDDHLLFPDSVVRLDQDQAFIISMKGDGK